jgi:hypothetical protein
MQTVGQFCSLDGELLGTSLHTLQMILILTSDILIAIHIILFNSEF